MFYNTDWTGVSIPDFIKILNNYLVWYNELRIKKSLGYMSPMEYRRSLGVAAQLVQEIVRTPDYEEKSVNKIFYDNDR